MFTISLFDGPSRTDTVVHTTQTDFDQATVALQKHIDQRTQDTNYPTYFSFANWSGPHELSYYKGSTGIVLEYSKRTDAEWAAIKTAIDFTGFRAYVFETRKGMAFVFPTTNCLYPNTYSRMAGILAELVGQKGLVAEPGATYLVQPKKGATVWDIGSDILPENFIETFRHVPNNTLAEWREPFVSAVPTRMSVPVQAQITTNSNGHISGYEMTNRAGSKFTIAAKAQSQKALFDSLFEAVDDRMKAAEQSAAELRAAVMVLKNTFRENGGSN
jgi:hypothetical protein